MLQENYLQLKKMICDPLPIRMHDTFTFVNDFRRTSSVTKMLNDLQWEPLSDRRQTARLCQFYQIHHGTSPVTSSKLQARNAKFSSRRYTVDAYKQIETRTVRFQNSFFPRTIVDWNKLPLKITSLSSLEEFKAALNI